MWRAMLTSMLLCVILSWQLGGQVLAGAAPRQDHLPSLRELADKQGLFIGTCVDAVLLPNNTYRDMVRRHFSIVTPEGEMKWAATEPEQNHFVFGPADTIVRYAEQESWQVRGHNLAWDISNPSWLMTGNFTGEELRTLLRVHIDKVVGRYQGRLYSWDVVNEGIASHPTPHLKTNIPPQPTVWWGASNASETYLDMAFRWAHEADPHAKLFYNDGCGEGVEPKAQTVYELVKGMRARGVPVHGVGLEMHFSLAEDACDMGYQSPEDVERNMHRLAALGVEIHVTEMDVRINNTEPETLQRQAEVYGGILRACLNVPACKSFEVWGFTDAHSDHSKYHADIFDEYLRPKPAFWALVKELKKGRPTATVAPEPRPDELPSLRELADKQGLFIGTCVDAVLLPNNTYRDMVRRHFSIVTPEGEMKWAATEPEQNHFVFGPADAIVRYAEHESWQVRGHNLAWDIANPSWLMTGNFTGEELRTLLRVHIDKVVGRYQGRLYSWDVVNEGIASHPTPHLKTNIPPQPTVWWGASNASETYLDMAFRWAHEADPHAKLFYNDGCGEGVEPKAQTVYELVKGMRARGVPVHGVGLEMHFSLTEDACDMGYQSPEDVERNMHRLAALGVEIHVTEMDVRINNTEPETLQRQAEVYGGILRACLNVPACKSFEVWGFTDAHSWASKYHADIFDEYLRPKPAFWALVKELKNGRPPALL